MTYWNLKKTCLTLKKKERNLIAVKKPKIEKMEIIKGKRKLRS